MKKLINGTALVAEAEGFEWVDEQHGWGDGKTIYADTERQFTVVADTQKVSPVEFKLLFTPQERVAIKNSEDEMVKDFFDLVENQRLVNAADPTRGLIDFGLQSTRDAVAYTMATIAADLSYDEATVSERIAQIGTGVVQ